MSSAEAKNLEAISKAIDHHNASCEWPAVAVELSPFEVERLGWDQIRGLPVRANPELGTGRKSSVENDSSHGAIDRTLCLRRRIGLRLH